MNSEHIYETLQTALKAAIRGANLKDHVVLDNGVDTVYVLEYTGEQVDIECAEQGVVVIRIGKGERKVTTIAGDKMVPCTMFQVWYPKYDSGDASVGIWPYWYTDDTDTPDKEYHYVSAVGEDIALYFVRENIAIAMEGALERLDYQRAADLSDDEIFS